MFSHNSYLRLGNASLEGVNPLKLTQEGYELSHCNYSFVKNIDEKGEVQSITIGGVVKVEISSLPTEELIEWSLNPRKYFNGAVVFCDDSGIPLEKIYFDEAACVSMEISYIKTGRGYMTTKLVLSAKKMTIGQITYDSRWVNK